MEIVAQPDTALTVKAHGDRGKGGAFARYTVDWVVPVPTKFQASSGSTIPSTLSIYFQEGSKDKGVNGITNEVLLEVVAHRLQSFQEGPFPHACNEVALAHLRGALDCLHNRTAERVARGVEGLAIK